jgi:hypothetical protein
MGTIRFATGPDGEDVGLYDHEGWVGMVLDDGTETSVWNADTKTRVAGWRAGCSCGWRSETVVSRTRGRAAFADWDDLPELEAEWIRHTDPLLAALAGEAQTMEQLRAAKRGGPLPRRPAPTVGPLAVRFRSHWDAARIPGVIELARLLVGSAQTGGLAERLHDLAVATALRQALAGSVGERIHQALAAGASVAEVVEATGWTADRVEGAWRAWAEARVAAPTYGRQLLDQADYDGIARRFSEEQQP